MHWSWEKVKPSSGFFFLPKHREPAVARRCSNEGATRFHPICLNMEGGDGLRVTHVENLVLFGHRDAVSGDEKT